MIPATHWWTLRKQFKSSIPPVVNAAWVAALLNMQEKSAKTNIISSLVMMGIIDEAGVPTDRAKRWRDDTAYPDVCREIREELYPADLLEISPIDEGGRAAAKRWFSMTTGVGITAVKRYFIVYELLSNARLAEAAKPASQQKPKASSAAKRRKADEGMKTTETMAKAPEWEPAIHIDIQVHISPDASLDQIDQIFASMAKHLRSK